MIILENGGLKIACKSEIRPILFEWMVKEDWVFIWDIDKIWVPLGPGGDAEETQNQLLKRFQGVIVVSINAEKIEL